MRQRELWEQPWLQPRADLGDLSNFQAALDRASRTPHISPNAPQPTLGSEGSLDATLQQLLQQSAPSRGQPTAPPPPPPMAPPGGYDVWNPARDDRRVQNPGLLFRDRLI